MEKLKYMTFWTVQPREVLNILETQDMYVPTVSASIQKLSYNTQHDDEYISQYRSLFRYALTCLYQRNGILDSNMNISQEAYKLVNMLCYSATGEVTQEACDDLSMVFAFASLIDSPTNNGNRIFGDMSFEEFKEYIAEHFNAIDSLWENFDPNSVILKVRMPASDYCPMDINSWQFLMPPQVIMPPFTEDDITSIESTMHDHWSITESPLPSGIYQVVLPFLTQENIIEIHDMIPYEEMKTAGSRYFDTQLMDRVAQMYGYNCFSDMPDELVDELFSEASDEQ